MPSIAVDGYPIAYAEAGSGPPLVMIHGTLGDQRSWSGQMAAFGERFHAIAVSLRHPWPGTWDDGGDFTIARHTADIAGFIKALGAGKVRLIGHSRGGHIAFRVAQHHPELIESLVLLEPGGELAVQGRRTAGGGLMDWDSGYTHASPQPGTYTLRWSGGWRGSPPHAVVVEAVLDGGTDRERRWRFEQLVLPGAGTVTLGTLDVED